MKLSQIEKRIPQTLTNSKDIIQTDREYARRSSRGRSTRGQENEAWALYKKFLSWSPEVTFLPPYPAGWTMVWADGRSLGRALYGHVITKFSRMDRFT